MSDSHDKHDTVQSDKKDNELWRKYQKYPKIYDNASGRNKTEIAFCFLESTKTYSQKQDHTLELRYSFLF